MPACEPAVDPARLARDDAAMCCFSPVSAPASFLARLFGGGSAASPPVHVSDTNIFARLVDDATQALAYSLELSVAGAVAMILPVPVATGLGEDALEFVNLERHANFFERLATLFMVPEPAAKSRGGFDFAPQSRPVLRVQAVGSFEASFVPTMGDWDRLDARFRLPDGVWQKLGGYDDWGFAVFRLAPGKKAKIHPMAFRWKTRAPSKLFFPTVHVHDGKVHDVARFDHTLYYQTGPLKVGAHEATQSADEASFMKLSTDAEGIALRDERVFRRTLRGKLPNRDTWIEVAAAG